MTKTKTLSVNLREHEVRKLLEDGELLMVRPLRPQPRGDDGPYERAMASGIGGRRGEYAFRGAGEWEIHRSPIGRVGERRLVKECWRVGDIGHGPCVEYRAGGLALGLLSPERLAWADGLPGSWRPGRQLPAWAARLSVDIGSLDIKRPADLTEEEAAMTGVERQDVDAEDRRDGLSDCVWIAPGTHAGWGKRGENPHWHVNAKGAFGYLFQHHEQATVEQWEAWRCWVAMLKRVG